MVGAVVGGFIFGLLHIDLGLGEIKITFEDLISAFVGSLLCIITWRLIRKDAAPKKQQKSGGEFRIRPLPYASLSSPVCSSVSITLQIAS